MAEPYDLARVGKVLTPRPLTSGFASNGCVQNSVVLMLDVWGDTPSRLGRWATRLLIRCLRTRQRAVRHVTTLFFHNRILLNPSASCILSSSHCFHSNNTAECVTGHVSVCGGGLGARVHGGYPCTPSLRHHEHVSALKAVLWLSLASRKHPSCSK